MSNARKNQVPNARDQYTTLVVTDEHGKEDPIEYAVDYERAPDAIEAVARLYAYLGDRLPFIAGVLRSDICTKHISPCLLCDELLGDLFAVVDHFMTTERDTIRAAYQKIWPSEEEESQTAEEEDDEKDEGLLDAKKAILASLGEPWETRTLRPNHDLTERKLPSEEVLHHAAGMEADVRNLAGALRDLSPS